MESDLKDGGGALRILMVAPTPFFSDRGCHVRIHEEARALRSLGHEVGIVAYHLGRDVGEGPIWRSAPVPWYKKTSAGPSWHKPYIDLLLLIKTLRLIRSWRPSLLHAHLHEGAFIAIILRRLTGVPVVFDCQGSLAGELVDHGFCKKAGLLHKGFVLLEKWITHQVGRIVTSSTNTAKFICNEWPSVSQRVVSLIDAVDTDNFRPFRRNEDLLSRLKIPSEKKMIVYLGAMTKYQGFDLLIDALAIMSQERDDFHALLMGYPDGAYRERARQLGLDGLVSFTGQLDYSTAPLYLGLGDIAVSPKLSMTEANGKLLNYMACGLPCVVFDSSVNRELLGDCGVYVKERTPQAFADELSTMLDNPSRCHEVAKKSRSHVVANHSWSVRIGALVDVYRELLSGVND